MTELLDRAIKAAMELPAEMQDEIAGVVLTMLGDSGPVYRLSPAEEADIEAAEAEVQRGELATEDEVRTMWARHGL